MASNKTFDPNLLDHFLSNQSLKNMRSGDSKKYRALYVPDFSHIRLYLWTPEIGKDNPLEFSNSVTVSNFLRKKFDPKRKTKIICHGWLSNAKYFVKPFLEGNNFINPHLFNLIIRIFHFVFLLPYIVLEITLRHTPQPPLSLGYLTISYPRLLANNGNEIIKLVLHFITEILVNTKNGTQW